MFAKLTAIEKIILPSDTTVIESNAFYRCPVQTVIIPECIETLDPMSFELSGIESVYVNATRIKNNSFDRCRQLRSIMLGEKVKYINGAFDYHEHLENINISPQNKYLKQTDGCILNSKSTQLILYIQKEGCTRLAVPEGIERICGAAFQGKHVLTDIVLPNSLQFIGSGAFVCTSLEEIHIPCNVTMITGAIFPTTLKRIYFHAPVPPEIKGKYLVNDSTIPNNTDLTIFIPQGCLKAYTDKIKNYNIQETDYKPQEKAPKKEVKNRAFYRKLSSEIKAMTAMEITNHDILLTQGRFAGRTFINVWNSNLYYIKWMIRIGAITDITKDVFTYLQEHYTMKRTAINNLKGLLTASQIMRAEDLKEKENLKKEYLDFIAEQIRNQEYDNEIEEANRQFEEIMNEYDAWGNLD